MDKHPRASVMAWSSVWAHVHGGLAGGRKEKDMSRAIGPFVAQHLLDSPT